MQSGEEIAHTSTSVLVANVQLFPGTQCGKSNNKVQSNNSDNLEFVIGN